MKIGYCSPFNPLKSGISDFSEELVGALSKKTEVILFTPIEVENDDIKNKFKIHKIDELDKKEVREELDILVFHMGNNYQIHKEIEQYFLKYPGILELHDWSLHHFAAEKYVVSQKTKQYLEQVQYCHGDGGTKIAKDYLAGRVEKSPWDSRSMEMCMNKYLIDRAKGVIVHSEMVKQMVLGVRPDVPVVNIMLHAPDTMVNYEECKSELRTEMNIAENQLILGSFGFASKEKRIIPILNALSEYKKQITDNFKYYIVGKVQGDLEIDKLVSKLGIEDNVVVTGMVALEDFKKYMQICDISLNLRYPTQGESSASLHRMLGMGIPMVLTNIGTFGDYPDEIAAKVSYGEREVIDILEAIYSMTSDKKILKRFSEKAYNYAVQYCNIDSNAEKYIEFFHEVSKSIWEPQYEDIIISRMIELGLIQKEYTEKMAETICEVCQE